MQLTSPYWNTQEFSTIRSQMPLSGHLGFMMQIPWPEPVTVGSSYFGENPLPGRREVVTQPWGEYYAIGNTIPERVVDPKEARYQFQRRQFTYKI